jgi:Protein of unknown function (DUF3800)
MAKFPDGWRAGMNVPILFLSSQAGNVSLHIPSHEGYDLEPQRISSVLSASGVPLEGNKLVRVTYIDESGLSRREPVLVQAGVIVHGDDQLVPVEEHLEYLVQKHIPADKRDGFFFHATDIYGGGKQDCLFHDKHEWPDERRWAILDDLAAIPDKFDLPVCIGIIQKADFPLPESTDRTKPEVLRQIDVAQHAMAIIQCEVAVELWLRKHTEKEITHVIAENNDEVRLAAREAHTLLRDPQAISAAGGPANHPVYPFKRIRDGLQFTTKSESRLLQIADICAWAMRRYVNVAPNARRFFQPIRPMVIFPDAAEVAALEALTWHS